jgi:hypothetical protein
VATAPADEASNAIRMTGARLGTDRRAWVSQESGQEGAEVHQHERAKEALEKYSRIFGLVPLLY